MQPIVKVRTNYRKIILSAATGLLLLILLICLTTCLVKAAPDAQVAPTATIPAKTVGYITAAPPVSLNTPSTIDSIQVKALVEGGPLVAPNTGLSGGFEEGIVGLVLAITGLLFGLLGWFLWSKYQRNRRLRPVIRPAPASAVVNNSAPAYYSNNTINAVSQPQPVSGYAPTRPPSPAIDNVPPRPSNASATPVFNQAGSGATIICSNCNQTLRAGSKFCGFCATPVKTA